MAGLWMVDFEKKEPCRTGAPEICKGDPLGLCWLPNFVGIEYIIIDWTKSNQGLVSSIISREHIVEGQLGPWSKGYTRPTQGKLKNRTWRDPIDLQVT